MQFTKAQLYSKLFPNKTNMNKQVITELEINGETYVLKSDANKEAQKVDGMPYVLIRTFSAGVHLGYLKSREGKEVTLVKARRVWSWVGAASLSQLSQDGVLQPSADGNKFSIEIPEMLLIEAIEIIPVSEKAKKNIDSIPVWKK